MMSTSLTTSTTINHPKYIEYELNKYGITYERFSLEGAELLDYMKVNWKHYVNYDVFKSEEAIHVPAHYHKHEEARLIFSGQGKFELIVDDQLLTIVVTSGDYISIPAGTEHTFTSTGPLTAIRYFSTTEPYQANYITPS